MRPRRSYNPEVAVASAVGRLLDRFDYPDESQRGFPAVGDQGGGAPTIVLAAQDASDLSKSKADLIANGVNDEEIVRFAYDEVKDSKGRVLLTEGTLNISIAGKSFDCIVLDNGGTIQGMGPSATILNVTDEPDNADDPVILVDNIAAANDTVLKDFAITGGVGVTPVEGFWAYSRGTRIEGCRFDLTGYAGTLAGDEQIMTRCRVHGSKGINIDGAGNPRIADCVVNVTGDAVDISGFPSDVSIIGCLLGSSGAAGINNQGDPNGLVLIGNRIDATTIGISLRGERMLIVGNRISGGTGKGIELVDPGSGLAGRRIIVAENTIHDFDGNGIDITGADVAAIVHDNILDLIGGHGILLTTCDGVSVHDNHLHQIGVGTFNTSDAIRLVTTDRAHVHDNTIRVPWLSGTGSTRYGVHIVSGSCNIVIGNDLGTPSGYGQDALGDFGTDTMLFYPNAGFYGDNFTDCPPGS